MPTNTTDTTLIGNNGSTFASQSYPEAIPRADVNNLFDFTVQLQPVYQTDPNTNEFIEIPNRHTVTRTDNGRSLNVVAGSYSPHQITDVLLTNLDAILDASEGDVQIHGAGLLKHGAVGWVQVTAPTLNVGGDNLAPTLTLASSHDGSLATTYRVGLHRFRCSNQLPVMKKRAGAYKLRHTKHSHLSIQSARTTLGIMWEQADKFAADVQHLIDTELTNQQFHEIIEHLDPKPEGPKVNPGALTRWETRRDQLVDMWHNDERVGFTGTGWGAMQTLSTFRHWERPVREMTGGQVSPEGRAMADYLTGRATDADLRTLNAIRFVAA